MHTLNLLNKLEFGQRIAEDEADDLEKYFLQTEEWKQLESGKIDVVYGAKGSGKSALYTLLMKRKDDFKAENILLAAGENMMGDTIFKSVVTTPPASEVELQFIWKIYCLSLIANALREQKVRSNSADSLIDALVESGILPSSNIISSIFKSVKTYVRNWAKRDAKSVEHAISIDPTSQLPVVTRKVEFAEADEQSNFEKIPVDELFGLASLALSESSQTIWLLFDRLDVAFADNQDFEKNALRALFRFYNYLKGYPNIKLKIFVRDDIWRRITDGGFTEASHITKTLTIKWKPEGLLNLIMLRFIKNKNFIEFYDVDRDSILTDHDKQNELFYKLAPKKVLSGKNPDTFDWILSRISDGTGVSAPRELIHFFERARELQIKRFEQGLSKVEENKIFDKFSFIDAIAEVSKVRYEQTLLAEYPTLKIYLEKLKSKKSEQTLSTLGKFWSTANDQTLEIADKLVDIGFFKKIPRKEYQAFFVPFLYRPALNLVQGKEK